MTLIAQAPAELVAVALLDDAALAGLPLSAAVEVPLIDAGIFASCLVLDTQVTNDALSHVAKTDIALGALVIDVHLSCLRNLCITVMAQHDADVQVMKERTGI